MSGRFEETRKGREIAINIPFGIGTVVFLGILGVMLVFRTGTVAWLTRRRLLMIVSGATLVDGIFGLIVGGLER